MKILKSFKKQLKILLRALQESLVLDPETSRKGDTALMLAAYNGQSSSVEVLLRAGANVEVKGTDGSGLGGRVCGSRFATAFGILEFCSSLNIIEFWLNPPKSRLKNL